jgi:transglutaminase-like putative cysteine protease
MVGLCHNEARLTPKNMQGQTCLQHQFLIDPYPLELRSREDFFGNTITYFQITENHKHLFITSESLVEKNAAYTFDTLLAHHMPWEEAQQHIFNRRLDLFEVLQFTYESDMIGQSEALMSYAQQSFTPGISLVQAVLNLVRRIYEDFEFVPGFTTVGTPVHEVMAQRKGVCQDFAQVAIGCLRSMQLPARYVSGYIETMPPPGQHKMVGTDASHAWFSVYIPGLGWVDFDPTNNLVVGEQHITLAWGRDYADVPPLKGVIYSSGSHRLKVSVDITRVPV